MSIPAKITSIENHITEAYDKLDELGVDLTNIDKNLDNISNILDDLYEDYPKTTTTNVTEPSIDNTKAGKMEIDLKGNTEQTTYTGKNLLQLSHGNESKNGITYTENADGSITLNGTSTAGGSYNSTINLTLPAGTYTHSTTIPLAAGLYLSLSNQNYSMLKKDDSSITFTLNSETTFTSYIIWIDSGYTVNNLTLYPQLEVGSTATSFEPYVGKTASPNPDYPQDVEVVSGENTVKVVNKNLFDKNTIFVGYLLNDGTITSDNVYRTSDFIKVKGNIAYYKTYTASPRTKFYDKNKQVLDTSTYQDISIGGNAGTFTTPNNAVYFRFSFPISGGSAVDINTIQLEQGSTATTYTEHKEQDFPISLSSRNLYNIYSKKNFSDGVSVDDEGWITAEKNNTSGSSSIYCNIYTHNLDLIPGKQYAIILEVAENTFTHTSNFWICSNFYSTVYQGQFTTQLGIAFNTIESNTYINILTASTIEHWYDDLRS